MLAVYFFPLALIASSITSALTSPTEEEFLHSLFKRQAPGTPAYECHSNCGTAITLSRGASPCTDEAFLADYAACLDCAGPDGEDIWQYYGNTLTAAGTKCNLSTTPVSESGSTVESSTEVSVTPLVISSTSGPTGSIEPTISTTIIESTTAAPTTMASASFSPSAAANSTSPTPTVPITGGANSGKGGLIVSIGAMLAVLALGF